MTLIRSLRAAFHDGIALQYPSISLAQLAQCDFALNTEPQRAAFGDISSNAALIIGKQLGCNPRTVATQIMGSVADPRIARCEIAGPGFINLYLTPAAFGELTQELLRDGEGWFALPASEKRKRYCVEFVSANPTGPLHLGHGRNGIIGDVLVRVLRFLGHEAAAEFYINDAGAQIEKLGTSLRIRCEQLLGNPDKAIPEDGYHGTYLVAMAQKLIDQHGASVCDHEDAWFGREAKQILLVELQKTLAAYGMSFDVWFSELHLHESGAIAEALELLEKRGHSYREDGALWLRTTAWGDDKDRVVERSNGEYTYFAADVAYLLNKFRRGFDECVVVLGQDHHSYLTRLKIVAEALGYDPARLHVILYQLVTLKNEGELLKLSKRAGRIVGLADIIDTVGVDVARFFYLHRKADAHLELDLSLALKRTDENPVYYLQYAYVRAGSILEKAATMQEFQDISAADAVHCAAAEHLILKKIAALQGVLEHIGTSMQTHMLAYYTLELANLFHAYYTHNRVIAPQEVSTSRGRLLVVHLVRQTLGTCFKLLGISAPAEM